MCANYSHQLLVTAGWALSGAIYTHGRTEFYI